MREKHSRLSFTGKKFFYFSLFCLLLAFIIFCYFSLTNPDIFPVKTVKIKGSYTHISQKILQQSITPFVKTSLFALDASELQNSLQTIPWIANANIRRVFPSTIVITLTEKQASFVWNKTALITADGVLFSPPIDTFPKDLPQLIAPPDQESTMLQTVQQMDQILQPLALSVQQLTLTERQSWSLVLSNNIEVVLGQDDTMQRLQQFVAIYPKVIGTKAKNAVTVDMRYPNGLAVHWR